MKNIRPRVSRTGEAFAILLDATALALSASLVAACGAHAQSAHVRAGQAYSVDYKLKNSPDGAYPWAELVPAPDGNLYGTTWAGGTPADCTGGLGSGCGTLFRLDSSGTETVVWNFQGTPGPIHPRGSLLPEHDGSFYGFTNEGGSVSVCYKGGAHGCGTFFRFSADGGLKVLYNFGSQGGYSDAVQPDGAPIACGSGTFCATTYYGGTNENGTLFRITKRGKEQILYRFTGGSDGSHPGAYLVSDSSGNLYDVANGGGGSCNCGTVFRLAPDGTYTVLYTFQGGTNGGNPYGGLILDHHGDLYGIAVAGGDLECGNGFGCGIVFKFTPDGTYTVLHEFSGPRDGLWPTAPLTRDSKGNLYGTTWPGGDASCDNGYGCGVVFEITAGGKELVLHAFHGKDGGAPQSRVFIDTDGSLVGTTQEGGRFDTCPNGCGVIYKLSTQGN